MAKKDNEVTFDLRAVFEEFKEAKNIDRETFMHIIVEVFKKILAKKYNIDKKDREKIDKNFNIVVNVDQGTLEVHHTRIVVDDEDFEDEVSQIPLSQALLIEPDFEVDEEVDEAIAKEDFGRRDIYGILQDIRTSLQEIEKEKAYMKYKDRVGEIVVAEVGYQQKRRDTIVVDSDDIELRMPFKETIPGDNFKKGDPIRAVVKDVQFVDGQVSIILSRTDPMFLRKLIEQEIPEVSDGQIIVKGVVREPGQRAKIAVESFDDRIDPVGACVGAKGGRIHGIVRELRNENIDIINYTTNPELFITRALSPAKINKIEFEIKDNGEKIAYVHIDNDQVSLAIGKGGYNIKLACRLTGYDIEVRRDQDVTEVEDDVDLVEFADEIDEWVIEAIRKIGLDTAREVLAHTQEEIALRADLEDETVANVFEILKAEFED